MLTPYLPYPLYSGGQTRSFNLIKNLSKHHEITLCSFIRSDEEKKYLGNLSSLCRKIYVFKRRSAWSLINILLSGFTPYPFLVVIYLSKTLRLFLLNELKKERYDLIHAETFYVMPNIPKTNIPTLLVEQTIEYQVYQHYVEEFTPFFLKPILRLDVRKVKFWESYYWKKASKVIAVSEDDKSKMKKLVSSLDVEVVPNGVDFYSFNLKNLGKTRRTKDQILLYVGNFKWLQNREAVEILINKIWPKISREIPQLKLWIVGRGIDSLKKLETARINFDETVTNIQTTYQKADVVLAPIKGPGGTRLKVLEAMASGCPVVTTPVGIKGIEARHGKEVLVGNTEEELAQLTVKVLKNPNLSKKMVVEAKKLVASKYDWFKITNKLQSIYEDVCTNNK